MLIKQVGESFGIVNPMSDSPGRSVMWIIGRLS